MTTKPRLTRRELDAFVAELWRAIYPSERRPKDPRTQLAMLRGATTGLVANRRYALQQANTIDRLTAQVQSIALAGIGERMKVMGVPLIDGMSTPEQTNPFKKEN